MHKSEQELCRSWSIRVRSSRCWERGSGAVPMSIAQLGKRRQERSRAYWSHIIARSSAFSRRGPFLLLSVCVLMRAAAAAAKSSALRETSARAFCVHADLAGRARLRETRHARRTFLMSRHTNVYERIICTVGNLIPLAGALLHANSATTIANRTLSTRATDSRAIFNLFGEINRSEQKQVVGIAANCVCYLRRQSYLAVALMENRSSDRSNQ